MRAILYETYGPPEVLQLKDIPKPVPKDDELLIKIHATTVTSADWRVRSLSLPAGFGFLGRPMFGITKPRQPILGTELSGIVESVGKNVTKFKPGDQVFAFPGALLGSYAEYRCLAEDKAIAIKPANLSFEEASALSFGGATALDFLRRAKLQKGEKVLIVGAAGGVGSAAVQLAARHFGAEVTGVCGPANVDLVRSLGAKRVIDYTKEDIRNSGERYDVIMDTTGTAPYAVSKDLLKEDGRLALVLGGMGDMLRAPWIAMTSKKKVIAGPAAERAEDLRFLANLAEKGQFKPVISRRYPLEKIREAHAYVDTGHKQGNVVIMVAS